MTTHDSGLRMALRRSLSALVKNFDDETQLRVLIAWSGGADSTALLHAACGVAEESPSDIDLTALHVDHGLRETSSRDANWCRQRADDLDVPLDIVPLEMEAWENIEARARERRYAALRIGARRCAADVVWTAHHSDDALETALLNWMRGAGVTGMSSLAAGAAGSRKNRPPTPAWRSDAPPIQRPFLSLGREDIREYLRRHDIEWLADSGNRDPKHRRNRIRQELIPTIRAIAGPTRAMRRTLDNLSEEADHLERQVSAFVHDAICPTPDPESVALETRTLADAHSAIAAHALMTLARRLPSPVGWDHSALEKAHATAADTVQSARVNPPRRIALRGAAIIVGTDRTTIAVERDRGTQALDARRTRSIRLSTDEVTDTDMKLPWFDGWIELGWVARSNLDDLPPPSSVAWFDVASLPEELMIVGPEADADDHLASRMQPIGFDGHKRLADLLREANVPAEDRWRHPCLFGAPDGNSETRPLLWVPGARQAAATRITDDTDSVLVARLHRR